MWAWFTDRHATRKALQEACRHEWRVFSLYNEGKYWIRLCPKCKKQEPANRDGSRWTRPHDDSS